MHKRGPMAMPALKRPRYTPKRSLGLCVQNGHMAIYRDSGRWVLLGCFYVFRLLHIGGVLKMQAQIGIAS